MVFYSFMCCPFVFSKISLCSCLMVALPAWVFDSFMYWPLVFVKISLWICLIVTLSARVFDIFMYSTLVIVKIWLRRCLMVKMGIWLHHIQSSYVMPISFLATYITTVCCIFFMVVTILTFHSAVRFNLMLLPVVQMFTFWTLWVNNEHIIIMMVVILDCLPVDLPVT